MVNEINDFYIYNDEQFEINGDSSIELCLYLLHEAKIANLYTNVAFLEI